MKITHFSQPLYNERFMLSVVTLNIIIIFL